MDTNTVVKSIKKSNGMISKEFVRLTPETAGLRMLQKAHRGHLLRQHFPALQNHTSGRQYSAQSTTGQQRRLLNREEL